MSNQTSDDLMSRRRSSRFPSRYSEPFSVHQNVAKHVNEYGQYGPLHLTARIDEAAVIAMCPQKLGIIARSLGTSEKVRVILENARQRGIDVSAVLAALSPPPMPSGGDDMPWGWGD